MDDIFEDFSCFHAGKMCGLSDILLLMTKHLDLFSHRAKLYKHRALAQIIILLKVTLKKTGKNVYLLNNIMFVEKKEQNHHGQVTCLIVKNLASIAVFAVMQIFLTGLPNLTQEADGPHSGQLLNVNKPMSRNSLVFQI